MIATPNQTGAHNLPPFILGQQLISTDISNEIYSGNWLHPYRDLRRSPGEIQSHLRVFSYSGLKALFEYHGFQIEKLFCVGLYPFPTSIARILTKVIARHGVYLTMKVRKV